MFDCFYQKESDSAENTLTISLIVTRAEAKFIYHAHNRTITTLKNLKNSNLQQIGKKNFEKNIQVKKSMQKLKTRDH